MRNLAVKLVTFLRNSILTNQLFIIWLEKYANYRV